MGRRLLNLLTALSLLLFVAVCVLWVRGNDGPRAVEVVTARGGYWQFYTEQLTVGVLRVSGWPETPGVRFSGYSYSHGPLEPSFACFDYSARGGARSSSRQLLGCGFGAGTVCVVVDPNGRVWRGPPFPDGITRQMLSPPRPFWQASVRHVLAGATFGALPAATLLRAVRRRLRRRIRRRRGKCPACGYDLTGNVSGVCPECGEKGSDLRCPAPQN
jgi:hypothetical protein